MKIEKEEIACYLAAYVNLLAYAQMFPNRKIIEIFAELYSKGLIPIEPTIDNYKNMIQFYSIYCNIKILAFLKDELYAGIDEKSLADLEINDVDTINKTTIENYTKKEIVLYVRNALSHNDKEIPLYWLEHSVEEDIRIHILLRNTKASFGTNKGKIIPFELVLNQKSLNEITQVLGFNSKKRHLMGIGVKNIAARNYEESRNPKNALRKILDETYYYRNFYKTLSDKENKKMEDLSDENYIEEYQKFLSSKLIEQRRKKLSTIQKNTLYKNILCWQDIDNIIDINEIFDYEMGKIMPLGIAKIDSLYLSRLRALAFLTGISYKDSTNMLIEGLCYNNPQNIFNSAKYLFKSEISDFRERVKLGLLDEFNEMNLSISIFAGHLLDSLITEDEITIANKTYSRERIRNSFVHGRWYISDDLKWELFDGKKNEFEFDWHKSIEMIKLKNYLVNFLNFNISQTKNK